MSGLTPSQTIGPFFHPALLPAAGACTEAASRTVIEGTVRDGRGDAVSDALLEIWQPHGMIVRAGTGPEGAFRCEIALPPATESQAQVGAVHFMVHVFARGLLNGLLTRIYLEDDPRVANDPVLAAVPVPRRETLIARRAAPDRYVFDIHLQGERETVFFAV
jgi:protocatechuate 3,4-dioxygenase, alpha subunit